MQWFKFDSLMVSVAGDKTSVMREFATTMYLLVILRFLLGLLPGNRVVSRSVRRSGPMAAGFPALRRFSPFRAASCSAVPHEWKCMDYFSIESSGRFAFGGSGTFEEANHPRCSIVRLSRRLAGLPEPYLAFAAALPLANRRSRRGSS